MQVEYLPGWLDTVMIKLFLYTYRLSPNQLLILINGKLFYSRKQNPNQVIQ